MQGKAALVVCFFTLLVSCGGDDSTTGSTAPARSPSEALAATEEPESPPIKVPKDCPPKESELSLRAAGHSWVTPSGKDIKAGEACLVAPGGKRFSVTLHNDLEEEGFGAQNHNLSIYADSLAAHEVFYGDLVLAGDKHTFDIPALDKAVYLFRCDIHPSSMNGVLVVR